VTVPPAELRDTCSRCEMGWRQAGIEGPCARLDGHSVTQRTTVP
jgi:hypothetical protein